MKNIFLSTFFILLIFSIGIPLNVDAQTSRIHTVTVSSDVSSIKIPLVGTLTIFMKYSIDFEVRKPSIIEAGTTEKITLSPRNGVLTATFFLNGDKLTTIQKDIHLGSTTKFTIPGTLAVGEVYASPSLVVGMGVNGPSSPSDYVRLNSMSSIDFPIRVNNEIGNSNSVTVFFPMRIDLEVGGNINLLVTDIPIHADTIPIEVSGDMRDTIPLRKYYSTSTSLEVKDGSSAGYIQIYPTTSTSSGESVSSSNISVYVDGEYKETVSTKYWSTVYTGSGQHFIEVKFPETKSSSNDAIIYKSSDAFQRFDVKYPPSISSQPSEQMIASAQSPGLQCGPGTHEQNGFCLSDSGFMETFGELSEQLAGVYGWMTGFFENIFKGDNYQIQNHVIEPVSQSQNQAEKNYDLSQISGEPQIESLQILGYDARPINNLKADKGTMVVVGNSGGDGDALVETGERVAVYLTNYSEQKIVIAELSFGGTIYDYTTIPGGVLTPYNDATEFLQGEYAILTDPPTSILTKGAGEVQPLETVTVLIDLVRDLRVGDGIKFKVTTSNDNVFLGTVYVGERIG